jgi:hypothetical protein
MKNNFIYLLLLLPLVLFAQKPCELSVDVKDSIGTYKATKESIVFERNFGGTSNYIFFSLVLTDGMPSLNLQTIQKSKDFMKANCLDKNSKLFIQLENGKIITLLHINQDNCGTSVRDDKGFNNRINSGVFLFMKDTFDELKSTPISFIRIKYATETLDFVLRKELISEMDGATYYPDSFFITNLPCILN